MQTSAIASEKPGPGQRFDRWVLDRVRRRRGPTELPLELEYRHIYVMPTRFGFWFGILLALMTLGGLNFNNNMTLILGFLLAAIAQLTTVLAYRDQVGIRIDAIRASPVFAGEKARFRVLLKNPEERNRFAIQAISPTARDCKDIEPQHSEQLTLLQTAHQRGWMQMEPFRIENRYPFGFFRAWSVIIPRVQCLVYPKPAVNPPALPKTGRGDFGAAHRGEGDHFHGLREFQPGDPLRRIAWRTSARHQKLYSRVMETPSEEACELNWYLMGEGDTEKKLSVLTAWVLKAEHLKIPYSREMPGSALPAELGEEHRKACLEILALYKS
jgi:uncharacterized protein (DUF58 family)